MSEMCDIAERTAEGERHSEGSEQRVTERTMELEKEVPERKQIEEQLRHNAARRKRRPGVYNQFMSANPINTAKAAVAQVGSILFDTGATLRKAARYCEEAADAGARLIVFPEGGLSAGSAASDESAGQARVNRGTPPRLRRCRSFSSASSHQTRAWRPRGRGR